MGQLTSMWSRSYQNLHCSQKFHPDQGQRRWVFNRDGLSAAPRLPCEGTPGPVGICKCSGDHESIQTLQRGLGCSQPPVEVARALVPVGSQG